MTQDSQSNTTWFEITPTDTLFFRDGRPYNKDESITLAGVRSLFPPSPATIAGAILANYAKSLNWDGASSWADPKNKKVKHALGTGDDINPKFSGVFLKKGEDLLLPVPQHLVELRPQIVELRPQNEPPKPVTKDSKPKRKFEQLHDLAFLTPSTNTYLCDIGNVYLPEVAIENQKNNTVIKPLADYWITEEGLKQCLRCKIDNQKCFKKTLYHSSELWSVEPRVGIAINADTGVVEDGALYSPTHIRLHKDVSMVISVRFDNKVDGSGLSILGGEARTADISAINTSYSLPNQDTGNLIYIASPMPINNPNDIPDLTTACMPPLQRIGGWNSTTRRARSLLPFLTPGTVLFMDDKDKTKTKTHSDWQEQFNILKPTEFTQHNFGYGQFFLGSYKTIKKETR